MAAVASAGASGAGRPIAPLVTAPIDADLFQTADYDEPAAEALNLLDEIRGINAANASKLLHQKRPGMFPIFDQFARRALNLTWSEVEGVPGNRQLLQRYRETLSFGDNREALSRVIARLGENGTEPLAGKPAVRVLDVLAWCVIYYDDPFC